MADKRKTNTWYLTSSQHMALHYIIDSLGGTAKVAKILTARGVPASRQLVNAWQMRGKVPVSKLAIVAKVLKLPPELLNFHQMKNFLAVDWKKAVLGCKLFTDEQRRQIFAVDKKAKKKSPRVII